MGKAERIIALIERCLPLIESFGDAILSVIEKLVTLLERIHKN